MGVVVKAQFLGEQFQPSDDLDEIGLQKWAEFAGRAQKSGKANAADLLTCYCQVFARRKRSEAQINSEGLTVTNEFGAFRAHPLSQASLQLTIELRQLSKALGFDIKDVGSSSNAKEKTARRLLD